MEVGRLPRQSPLSGDLQLQLRGTEKEWRELEAMLGRPGPPRPPIKLDAPVRRHGTVTRSSGAYVTKVIVPR
jgi:hypothetical protein